MMPASVPAWEHFRHDADIGVRGYGRSLAEAFEQAALALQAVVVSPDAVAPVTRITISCREPAPDYLLTAWLNAIVYAMATRKILFHRFSVQIQGEELVAEAWGEPVDVARHAPTVEVKGATLTELYVGEDAPGVWRAQTVVDV